MDLNTALGGPVSRTWNGSEYTFPRMSMADWAKVQSHLTSLNRQSLGPWVKILREEGGITSEVVAALVRDLERPPTFAECRRWVLTPEGALYVLKIACERSEPPVERADLCEMAIPAELMGLAAEVAQLTTVSAAAKGDADTAPLPTTSGESTG